MQLTKQDYKMALAPFAFIIGDNTFKPKLFVLVDADMSIIYQTEQVWVNGDYSPAVLKAMVQFDYDEQLSQYNCHAADTLEDAYEHIDLRSGYMTDIQDRLMPHVLSKLRKMKIENVTL